MKPIIGVGAAILRDKKILLTKRVSSKKNFPNCWTFPAGRLKPTDKSLEAAAIREIKEEIDLDFVPEKKLNFYETQINNQRIIGIIFLGNWSGKLKFLESEISEVGWFAYKETKKLRLAFVYKEAIEDLHNLKLI